MTIKGGVLALILSLCFHSLDSLMHPQKIATVQSSYKNIFSRREFPLSACKVNKSDQYATTFQKPRWGGKFIGPIVRYLDIGMIAGFFFIILRLFNKVTVVRNHILIDKILKREEGRGLLTVSNHQSMADDPGLFAAVIPWWKIRPDKMRWVLCTEGVFFWNKILQRLLGAGNVMPLDRTGSIEQPLFKAFHEKLADGSWCHIYPEGKVRQNWRFEEDEPKLGDFKFGVGKLIAHCQRSPIVLPIFHKGMDQIIPEKILPNKKSKKQSTPISIFPGIGKDIHMYIGESLDFTEKIKVFEDRYPGMLSTWKSTQESINLYAEITNDIKLAILELENEAYKRGTKVSLNLVMI